MSIDLQALTKAIFDQLAVDTDGVAVRAALGAGAASVITADELNVKTLHARPLIALRRLPVGGQTDEMRPCNFQWWLYDDPNQGRWRLNRLAQLVADAYGFYSIPFGRTTTSIGGDGTDDTLGGLLFTTVRVVYIRRG